MGDQSGLAATQDQSQAKEVRALDIFLACVALFVLAVAQPLLGLLGRNAEFFLAHVASQFDIVLVGVILAVAAPVLIGLIVVGVWKFHQPTGTALVGIVIAALVGILVLQIIAATPAARLPAWVELTLSGGVGVLVAIAFFRFESARLIGRFAAIAPILVLGLFLFGSSTSKLVFASNDVARPSQIAVEAPAPVVMVVFDEFPVASIMDDDGDIQAETYPGFSRLAADGTWFRNAITVQQQTEHSLPVILTGKNTPAGKLPTAGDYPFTLFTLLADTYDLHVHETISDLCPAYACENTTRPTRPFALRWRALIDDLRIVSGHIFLPDDMADDLPPIDATWSNFSAVGADNEEEVIARFRELTYSSDRREPIGEFVRTAGSVGAEPRFSFLHALVPHVPWEYLPSGQTYSAPAAAPGSVSPGWGDDEWLVDQAYQMHLAQVGYADTVVEDLIGSLERAGVYDETLIIVVADHGVAVRPGVSHRRAVTDETIGDIAAIPLFIKRPNHGGGEIDDYRAETIDIVPTIADVLGIDLPWAAEGVSLFSGNRPERAESRIEGSEGTVVFGTDGSEVRALAARKIEHFGEGGPFGLAPAGHRDLLGRPVEELDARADIGLVSMVSDRAAFDAVDLDGSSLPAWISGTIRTIESDDDSVVAVAVNGRVAAVTRFSEIANGTGKYAAMLRPDAFVDGENEVIVLLVRGTGDERRFLKPGP
jgi:hypothetical protein